MLHDKYNYSLNGIEHEIILNHTIKIDQTPINQIILVSNKYLLKYINDLFDYHNIEYCLTGNSLLGSFIFNGINIFNSKIEICTDDINFFKLKKLEDEIKNDDIDIVYNENLIKISTIFFNKVKSIVYIYPLKTDDINDCLNYINSDNKLINHSFYDIYPIKKNIFEDYQISLPNKIDKVLESYGFNMNFISFTKNKNDKKKIIDEVETKLTLTTIVKDGFNKIISVIKPFIFTE